METGDSLLPVQPSSLAQRDMRIRPSNVLEAGWQDRMSMLETRPREDMSNTSQWNNRND